MLLRTKCIDAPSRHASWHPINSTATREGQSPPVFYGAQSLAVVRDPGDHPSALRLLVGAGRFPGGEGPGVYRSSPFLATASATSVASQLTFSNVFEPSQLLRNDTSLNLLVERAAMMKTALAVLLVGATHLRDLDL